MADAVETEIEESSTITTTSEVTHITVGEAWTPESGATKDTGKKGDQRHSSATVDYDGEVRLTKRSVSEFLSYYENGNHGEYMLYRPIDPAEAAIIASTCITACNNPNVGYSQNYSTGESADMRTGIFKYGAASTVPINCDCSSLGSYCAYVATGVNFGAKDSRGIGSALVETGHFWEGVSMRGISKTNLPYNGDIIAKNGHVAMIVAGHPREGMADETIAGWPLGDLVDSGTGAYYSGGLGMTTLNVAEYVDQFGATFQFVRRSEEPLPEILYYMQTYGINQNGSYAWGRFSEIMQSGCTLFQGEARKWFLYKEDGYKRDAAPNLGAVMCFTNIYNVSDPGIVCIVEKIEKESIWVSQRNNQTGAFEYIEKKKRNGSWDMDLDGDGKYEYRFQGFIYNPAVGLAAESRSALNTFVELAKAQSGTTGDYTKKLTGVSTKYSAWSAAFIMAVAQESGSLLNTIIPNTYSCSDIGRIGFIRGMGRWFDGPSRGTFPEPQVGDIALFRTADIFDRSNRYAADKAGIVIEVGSASSVAKGTNQQTVYGFKVVMGDCEGKVKTKSYNTNSGVFSGLYRPDWERVDGTTKAINQYTSVGGMYTEGTSADDAAIRDLRFVSLSETGFEPSIKSSGSRLCAINYTGMLANLYSMFAEVGSSSATNSDLVVDLWNNTVKSVYQNDQYPMITFVSEMTNLNVNSDATISGDPDGQSVLGTNLVISNPGGAVTTETNTLMLAPDGVSYDAVMGAEIDGGLPADITPDDSVEGLNDVIDVSVTQTIVLTTAVKNIYEWLNAEFNNPASVIGIMANMYHISAFDASSEDPEIEGVGLIHWIDYPGTGKVQRKTQMKKYCKNYTTLETWENNPEGQIKYLIHEALTISDFRLGWDQIKRVSGDISGAFRAARLFLNYFILENGPITAASAKPKGTVTVSAQGLKEQAKLSQINSKLLAQLGKPQFGDDSGYFITNKESQEVEVYGLICGWANALWNLFFGGQQQK